MMKRITLFTLCTLVATLAFAIERKNISPNQLPGAARSYLHTYLADQSIRQCTQVTDQYKVTYEVLLTNNSTVIFNRDGGWKVVSMPQQTVPEDIIPADIQTFLKQNYGTHYKVTRIAKVTEGYRVTVDGQEILCNSSNLQHMQKQINEENAFRASHDGLSSQQVNAMNQKKVVKRRRFLGYNDDGSKDRDTQDKRRKSNGRP